jgi:cytochrome c-type biogenesis protein CcmH
MGIVVILLFGLLALVAAAFVAWPAWRVEGGGTAARLALTAAVALFVLAIGGGLYLIQGAPQLAERSLTKIEDRDYAGLIAMLSQDMRKRPNDVTGWIMLGRGYSKLRDPNDAAKAYARSIAIAGANAPAGLYALYGEALTDASGGEVTTDAAAAFEKAIALDPHDVAARYYLGLLHAQRRETDQALAIWRSLLLDAPKDAPWRADVRDRIAMLSAGNGVKPNIEAMVSGLDAKLKANPNDPQGWQMLIRAYVVLGRTDKAKTALEDARAVLAKDADAIKAIDAEARSLKLE